MVTGRLAAMQRHIRASHVGHAAALPSPWVAPFDLLEFSSSLLYAMIGKLPVESSPVVNRVLVGK
jgi:hypothetical protein